MSKIAFAFVVSQVVVTIPTATMIAGADKDYANLQKAWRDFEKTIAEGGEKKRESAFAKFQPSEDDFKVLFAKNYEGMWNCYKREVSDTKEILEELEKLAKASPITLISAREARSDEYKPVFDLMPKKVAVVDRLVIRRSNGTMDTAGPFILVNGRWVMMPFLREYPKRLEIDAGKKNK